MKVPTRILIAIMLQVPCAFVPPAHALDNGIGLLPIMGWNPWSCFKDIANLDTIRKTVDALESKGLKDAGYVYLNQDADKNNFSSLMPGFRTRGFKYGVYAWTGWTLGQEQNWVNNWVSRGADYLKYDFYNYPHTHQTFRTIRDAIAASGRKIIFNAHSSDETVNDYTVTVAHSWRTGPDIYIPWEVPSWNKVMYNVDRNTRFAQYAKPGYYNDPDFLLVGLCDRWPINADGTYGFTVVQDRTQFNIWCMMAAPLIIGSDIIGLTQKSIDILTNREMIAIDQDSLGYQGRPVRKNTDQTEIWSKKLKNGDVAVMLLNRSSAIRDITVRWSDIGSSGTLVVRDLWAHADLGAVRDSLTVASIPPYGSEVFRVRGQSLRLAPGDVGRNADHGSRGWKIITPLSGGAHYSSSAGPVLFDLQGKRTADGDRARLIPKPLVTGSR